MLITSCKKKVEGCTYSFATNYNSEATHDDGSCLVEAIDYGVKVGDFHEGGVVFWMDAANEHGLVCAIEDLGSTNWGDNGFDSENSNLIGAGAQNTMDLILLSNTSGTAIDLCNNLNLNGYSDWFLPSVKELEVMAYHKQLINTSATENGGENFVYPTYWTSTGVSQYHLAYFCNIDGGSGTALRDELYGVRAVRAF